MKFDSSLLEPLDRATLALVEATRQRDQVRRDILAELRRFLPMGTKVKWLQTEKREVFEAEGTVTGHVVQGYPESPGVTDEDLLFAVWVHFTKHPALARRIPGEGPFMRPIPLDELERLP